ncbi:hypothetical protein BdWA1_000511 [Babesia duncani]|uniref:HIT-type domain-containing protein n=1 Tax=Babesia duncani TaxID=323732 RepID=A0AAD9PMB5_9APIC|nr:hypothetical protein BdWA1_000511 [Babesia duncani]
MSRGSCNECGGGDARYKFKCCSQRFCSSGCFGRHECQGQVESVEISNVSATEDFNGEALLDAELLSRLRQSGNIKDMLQHDQLRSTLAFIAKAKDPIEALQQHLQDEMFVKFLNETLNVIYKTDDA